MKTVITEQQAVQYQTMINDETIPQVYRFLWEYMNELRTLFDRKSSPYPIVSQLNFGLMDYSYFTMTSESLRAKKLRFVIILDHSTFRFELWLVGQNKQVTKTYKQKLGIEQEDDRAIQKYRIPVDPGLDNIEHWQDSIYIRAISMSSIVEINFGLL